MTALIAIASLSFIGFIYPYVIYPLVLRLFPKIPTLAPSQSASAGAGDIRLSMFFCAYNEEASLPDKIKNIREIKSKFPDVQVFAYSDASSDRTWELLHGASDVITAVEGRERAGKATGMRRIVSMSDCDVCVFTDANVLLDPESINNIRSYFRDPSIGTVAGTLHYISDDETPTTVAGSAYWRLEEHIKHLESLTGSTMGADGSIFSTRKSLYPEVPKNLLDDLIVSITPLFSGHRIISAKDVVAYERLVSSSKEEFKRKRRIACRAFSTHLFIWPSVKKTSAENLFKYISHKYIRWFGAIPLTLLIVSLFGIAVNVVGVLAAFALFSVALAVAAMGYRMKAPIIAPLVEIALSIYATGWGVLEALTGKDYTTWTPAKSRA